MRPDNVAHAIELAKRNGAKGISFFDENALTSEQLEVIKKKLSGTMFFSLLQKKKIKFYEIFGLRFIWVIS